MASSSGVIRRVHGIGIDLVLLPRIRDVVGRYGDRFLQRAFHPREIQKYHSLVSEKQIEYLASRWAVKEATFKAFGSFRMQFPDVVILGDAEAGVNDTMVAFPASTNVGEKKSLCFYNSAAEEATRLNICEAHVSVSHDGEYATAYVLLEKFDVIRLLHDSSASMPVNGS